MILTRGLGYGGGIVARGFGAWIGGVVPPLVLPVPTAYGSPSHDTGGRRRRLRLRSPDQLLPDILPASIPGNPRGSTPAIRARADREDELFILLPF